VAVSAGYRLVQDGDTGSCFSLVQGYWSLRRLCRKMRSVVNTSSYPMSMFKEFYNKLLAVKKNCVAKLFGQPSYIFTAVSSCTVVCVFFHVITLLTFHRFWWNVICKFL
jgi:hypothetical protein